MNINKPSLPLANNSYESSLHHAVSNNKPESIAELRNQGERPVSLDANRDSPIDRLSKMKDIDETARARLHSSLLKSLNPTAPAGYIKPESFHGSSWGLEILMSGALKGGVQDKKGGSESLEGKVFFSDRTPEKANDNATRVALRSKPRIYSEGKGINASNASSRSVQHRMSQVLLKSFSDGDFLIKRGIANIQLEGSQSVREGVSNWMQNYIHEKMLSKNLKAIDSMPDEKLAEMISMPLMMTVTDKDNTSNTYIGDDLKLRLSEAAGDVKNSMENGKAPILSVINNGKVVPVVFGFSKIEGLKQHSISGYNGSESTLHNYQDENHPLSGTDKGGKLKEIELRSESDLATLILGCSAKKASIPGGVTVRIKVAKEKARYISPEMLSKLQAIIKGNLSDKKIIPEEISVAELQIVNKMLRNEIGGLITRL